ncbi:glycosyltransferase family 4 protein [Candidatus Collierbacteria bacterium]|nr:glycosyltransferase family 4 protein [Candidatus Collierbacteria bacterium]
MKIVLFTEFFPRNNKYFTGGVEVRVIRLYEYLKETGHDVTVVSRSRDYSFNSPLTAIQRIFFFVRWIAKIVFTKLPEADMVEGTNFTSYILAFIYAKKIKAKSFAWYPDVFLGKAVERLGLINGLLTEIAERISLKLPWDRIIALSSETKNKLISAGVDRGKISVIYGGVDIKKYKKVQKSTKKYNNATIICIARLVKYKRIQDLILAVYLLKDGFPDIKLILVGDGPERKKLKSQISNLKIEHNVNLVSKISEEDKIGFLAKSHLHVLPSAVEGFGLVTVEALSAGTPVVNADIPISREILSKRQTTRLQAPGAPATGGQANDKRQIEGGLLFNLGDYVDLAEKIEQLLINHELYDKKVKEGLELVKKYDWDRVNKEYEHLLSN